MTDSSAEVLSPTVEGPGESVEQPIDVDSFNNEADADRVLRSGREGNNTGRPPQPGDNNAGRPPPRQPRQPQGASPSDGTTLYFPFDLIFLGVPGIGAGVPVTTRMAPTRAIPQPGRNGQRPPPAPRASTRLTLADLAPGSRNPSARQVQRPGPYPNARVQPVNDRRARPVGPIPASIASASRPVTAPAPVVVAAAAASGYPMIVEEYRKLTFITWGTPGVNGRPKALLRVETIEKPKSN
ncbi:hypothetical protein FRC09_007071 [Ceratobasidium sp. 395]|nr:hypothetical protein FRC09_007071 [Ceratobasidium sp. 395]